MKYKERGVKNSIVPVQSSVIILMNKLGFGKDKSDRLYVSYLSGEQRINARTGKCMSRHPEARQKD